MNNYCLPSPAKINLSLYITGRKTNGYCNLQTVIQFINYNDIIDITLNKNNIISLSSNVSKIVSQNNLVIKAAKLLKYFCLKNKSKNKYFGVHIKINKIIPIGSGLGGASSNAATVLLILNKVWRCNLTLFDIAKIGLLIGTDVPLFIYGHAAIIEGIGDINTPVSLKERWYVVIVPPIEISTTMIFSCIKSNNYSTIKNHKKLLSETYYNDFESIVIKKFPIIKKYISWLSQYVPARLTGTGSCIFAECNDQEIAYSILFNKPNKAKGFVAKSKNISPLHSIFKNKKIFSY
ncbi:MAG: 4-(cytidine 5'-diphospho)-2-C-methyl-D-erythritol kinase [Candidatus Lightella neohaematopini]|nr:4-(cytidine 5'-diphospho)-2-C-methyl-D-erythritol kinase [Candidatus Lightella neohaematopini]MCV2529016.1 4-(cytidine 5'-diphospho)-2-C-methyl-D-erythritol kinase [Candidatus Lightella neohaematopini]